jgi:hypothetical protein
MTVLLFDIVQGKVALRYEDVRGSRDIAPYILNVGTG